MKFLSGLVAGALLTAAVPVCAQSLGELAKKEAERRKAAPPAAKTYTNEDLKRLPPMNPEVGGKQDPTKVEDSAKPVAPKGETAKDGEPAKDEKYLARPHHRREGRSPAQRDVQGRAAEPHQRAVGGLRQPRRSRPARGDRRRSAEGDRRDGARHRRDREVHQGDRRHRRRGAPRRRASRLAPLTAQILIVEDKDSLRTMLRHTLERQEHVVLEARDQPEAVRMLQTMQPAVVLSDLRLPEGDGFGVLRASKEIDADIPVIVMTAYGSIEDAVTAMKEGAMDFLAKPVDPDHLLLLVNRALEQRRIVTENLLLKEELAVRRGAPQLVGEDPSLRKVFASLQRAATTDATVLLEGESGTGKELFARSLHALSPRADSPFVAINCAAIPENLLETELFGYEKGAFTGAAGRKPGKFEMAHRGTLFLDEIGDLPMSLQAKILRALEEKKFERVGGTALLSVDVRLVAATNKGLRAAVAARRFREDLYFRLSVFPITDPAAARSSRRHPRAGAVFRRAVLPRSEEASLHAVAAGDGAAHDVSLARQRPRAAELHRARGDSRRWRNAPPAPPQSVVRRPAHRREPRVPLGARRSHGYAGGGDTAGDRRGREGQDPGSARRSRRQQGARRGAAADQLQVAARETERLRGARVQTMSAARELACTTQRLQAEVIPIDFSAAAISSFVTSATTSLSPIAFGST